MPASRARRRILRRISVGETGRLRTSAERLALLDVEGVPRELFGLSPMAIQRQHDLAFDVEQVTEEFFDGYKQVFADLQRRNTADCV